LEDLERTIKKAKEQFGFEGIITGALFSEYQSSRIQKIGDKLGLKVISPLWHKDQEEYMQELLDNKFEFIFTRIAADGLDENWLGKVITKEDLDKLKSLNKRIGLHPAGEGGEFESLVVNCPLFSKKLKIVKAEKVMENSYTGKLLIKEAKLVSK
jgi:asparagine synthase (glutamine-hydrolysing)